MYFTFKQARNAVKMQLFGKNRQNLMRGLRTYARTNERARERPKRAFCTE